MFKSTIILPLIALLVTSCQAQQAQRHVPQPTGKQANRTIDKPRNEGAWRQLFNGRDMTGWQHIGPGKFTVENGLLRAEGGMGLLWYTGEKLGDCAIRVVYKTTDPAANSGVFVRIADKPKDEWFAVHHGYEVQILDKQDDHHRTGAIYSFARSASLPARPTGEWNTMEITLRGERIIVRLNGVEVNDFDPTNPREPVPARAKDWEPERASRPTAGYIGIQNHGDYVRDKQTYVYFKEISVKAL